MLEVQYASQLWRNAHSFDFWCKYEFLRRLYLSLLFSFANMYFLDCFFFIILVWCVLLHFGTQLVTISSSKMLQSFQLKYNMLKHPAAPTGHYFSIFSFWTWASNGGITSILHCLVTLTPLRSNFGLPPSPTQYPVHRPFTVQPQQAASVQQLLQCKAGYEHLAISSTLQNYHTRGKSDTVFL